MVWVRAKLPQGMSGKPETGLEPAKPQEPKTKSDTPFSLRRFPTVPGGLGQRLVPAHRAHGLSRQLITTGVPGTVGFPGLVGANDADSNTGLPPAGRTRNVATVWACVNTYGTVRWTLLWPIQGSTPLNRMPVDKSVRDSHCSILGMVGCRRGPCGRFFLCGHMRGVVVGGVAVLVNIDSISWSSMVTSALRTAASRGHQGPHIKTQACVQVSVTPRMHLSES